MNLPKLHPDLPEMIKDLTAPEMRETAVIMRRFAADIDAVATLMESEAERAALEKEAAR